MDERLNKIIGTGECVVDLGCGSGSILNGLSERFEQRIGMDVSRQRLVDTNSEKIENWEFRETDLNGTFPLVGDSADVVIANQVIEHIYDPIKFASEMHRVVRPGGRCVITTPNIRYIKNIAHLLFSGYGPRTAGGNTLDGAWDDGHIHYFTHRDLREIFSHAGFKKINSIALIDLNNANWIRSALDRYSSAWLIREFLSGCILLWAEK